MIELKNVSKQFSKTIVFEHLSLCIPYHQISYLHGRSGIGKTTLLRILSGLESPDSGSIYGLDNKKISMVFQEDRLIDSLSIFTNIALPHLPHLPSDFRTTLSIALESVGLSISLDTKVETLSGGMKRRVALLRALLTDFDILILDEPFTGLDDLTKHQMIDFMTPLIANKTVILVSHDPIDLDLFGISNKVTLQLIK